MRVGGPLLTPCQANSTGATAPDPFPLAPQCRARRLRGRRRRAGRRGSASRRASAARRPWTCSSACWPPPSSCSPPAARAPPPLRLAWWRGTGGPGPCAAGWGPQPAARPARRRRPPGPPRTSPRGAPARLGRSSWSLEVVGAAGRAAGAPGAGRPELGNNAGGGRAPMGFLRAAFYYCDDAASFGALGGRPGGRSGRRPASCLSGAHGVARSLLCASLAAPHAYLRRSPPGLSALMQGRSVLPPAAPACLPGH